MAIARQEVTYVDPMEPSDVLSATPATKGGKCYGTIGVTHGADFAGSNTSNAGRSQSVCVKPGDELLVLARLGDRLRCLSPDDPDKTIVGTVKEFKRACLRIGLSDEQMEEILAFATKTPLGEGLVV